MTFWRRKQQELNDELDSHLRMSADDRVARGENPASASQSARREMGNATLIREATRDQLPWGGFRWLETLLQDLRYAFRTLRKSPGFTAVAILTLALGIGANTAIFSIVDAVLLRAFPYPNPAQLVFVFNAPAKQPDALSAMSYRDFREYRKQNRVFTEMAGNAFHDLTLTGAGEPSIVNTADVMPEIFSLLGVTPLVGRTLAPQDGGLGAAPVALLSENLWRSQFGANPSIIGQSISLDMRSFTVVGVLRASFHYPDGSARQDVWIAEAQDPLFGPRLREPGVPALGGIARLKPGISIAQAQAEMDTIAARLAKQFPAQDSGVTIRLVPYRQAVVGNVKSALLILLGAVGLVLLIACANIANLLLSRATSRGREIAVRIALGAGRARIVRQLLTESALLGFLGGIAGVLLAIWCVSVLRPFLPVEVTQINSIQIGVPVLIFALVLSLVAAIVFGLAPALIATPSNVQIKIKEGGERGGQRSGQHVRSVLAIAEISLAVVLLVGGGLLIRSFALVTTVNPGFDPNHVIEAEISLPQFQYSTPQQWTAFANELMARLHALPGMQDSALAAPLPMDRQGEATFPFTIVGNPPLPAGKSITADWATVSPDYFHVMRIPLLRGRFFSEQNSPSSPNVAIISETLAQRYFPNQDPLGRQMKFGFPPNTDVSREIVGIVGDVRDESLGKKPGPMMYVPFAQAPLYGGEVVVRSSLGAASVAANIRAATHAIDKDLPVTDIASFPDMLGKSISQERFRTFLLGAFAALALVLAAVGIFGVISYSAAQRTHEIGVRMALGAQPRDVLRLILGQAAKLALAGLGIGIVAALLLTRLMASMLYSVSATDPLTFIAVAILLLGVALLACYIPARRATKVDPIIALRYE
jgi:putative ABC transport system permease protein